MRNLAWWRAWYDLEPRGEDRGDWQTAILALKGAEKGTSIADVLRILKDCWHPVTREEKERRRDERRLKAQAKLRENRRKMRHEAEKDHGRQQHKPKMGR